MSLQNISRIKTIHHRLIDENDKVTNTGGVTILWEELEPGTTWAYALAINPYGSTFIFEDGDTHKKGTVIPNNYDKKMGRKIALPRLSKIKSSYMTLIANGETDFRDNHSHLSGLIESSKDQIIEDLLVIAEHRFFNMFPQSKIQGQLGLCFPRRG